MVRRRLKRFYAKEAMEFLNHVMEDKPSLPFLIPLGLFAWAIERCRKVLQRGEHGQVVWIKHYSSSHEILLVGEGDFSFSLSLANAFGSASNIVATSLDSHDVVVVKYAKAKAHLKSLEKMGATILHEVDATKMKLHSDLKMRKFDRIVFNFPHAGFKGSETLIIKYV